LLSKDYSPWGTFATQIYVIALILTVSIGFGVVLPLTIYFHLTGFIIGMLFLVVIPIGFTIWGMNKQTRELFGKK